MKVRLEMGSLEVARFQYSIHAMWAARVLSYEDDFVWRVVDERASVDDPLILEFKAGKEVA
jgi:predicted P-loop ATPase